MSKEVKYPNKAPRRIEERYFTAVLKDLFGNYIVKIQIVNLKRNKKRAARLSLQKGVESSSAGSTQQRELSFPARDNASVSLCLGLPVRIRQIHLCFEAQITQVLLYVRSPPTPQPYCTAV